MFGRMSSRRSIELATQRLNGAGNPMRGRFGPENPLYRRPRPEAVRQKLIARIMQTARPVDQLDRSGKVIASYESTGAACRAIGVTNGVHAVCTGKRRSAGGYKWRFTRPPIPAEQVTVVM